MVGWRPGAGRRLRRLAITDENTTRAITQSPRSIRENENASKGELPRRSEYPASLASMAMRRLFSPRAAILAAVAAVGLACAVVVSDSGPNQAAHFALVRSLASGTAEIDLSETIDASYVDGRYYAAKAPGLAMFTLPWYGTLRAAGVQDAPLSTGAGYRNRVWELNLFGAVLPMLALLLLMVVAAERVVPGYGLPAAVCSERVRSCFPSRRSSSIT